MVKSLGTYKKKRDLKATPEPGAVVKERARGLLEFVVQKHQASRLHYDFRLECDGVLLSWAVPKGPSTNPYEKRLAIMVEDHPYDYRKFEGIIPKGHYGAGYVIVWDKGTYYSVDENGSRAPEGSLEKLQRAIRQGVHKGKLLFVLKGKKLQGQWTLVRLKANPKQWLLIKHDDEYAGEKDITKLNKSVNATVATPVAWDELKSIYPTDFTVKNVPRRINEVGDLWADILEQKIDLQKLPSSRLPA